MADLDAWLGQPEPPDPCLQRVLYAKVVLALLTDRAATDVLDAQRGEHLSLMRELTWRKADGDLADQLICDHALFHLQADLRWLELTAARLDESRRRSPRERRAGHEPAGRERRRGRSRAAAGAGATQGVRRDARARAGGPRTRRQ